MLAVHRNAWAHQVENGQSNGRCRPPSIEDAAWYDSAAASRIGPRRVALFIRDPDGNVLEFDQLADEKADTYSEGDPA
ncbi:MAG: hypothetical protein JSS24_13915 [Proteobacteria bacterium]|nr:hypothetical protein [Pseudomonadota bacterium]